MRWKIFIPIELILFCRKKKVGTSVLMLFSYERQTAMNPFTQPFRAPITSAHFEQNLHGETLLQLSLCKI